MATDGEDALPARDGVRANDGVNSFELSSHILDGASRLVVQLEPGLLGNLFKARLLKGHGKGLEKLLVRLAEAIVDLVA